MTDDAAVAALVIYVVYLLLAFGLRMWVQLRRTGSTGFHGLGGYPGSPEWIAWALFAVALTFGFAAPLLALIDAVEPIDALDGAVAHGIGTALGSAACVGRSSIGRAIAASGAMGGRREGRDQRAAEGGAAGQGRLLQGDGELPLGAAAPAA